MAPPVSRLLDDDFLKLRLFEYLDEQGLASAECASRVWLCDDAWRHVFAMRWAGSLFELEDGGTEPSWRWRAARRARAKRSQLRVVGGRWLLSGTSEGRKGRVETSGVLDFAGASLALAGAVEHRRVAAGAASPDVQGTLAGALCAHFVPGAQKRPWALAWTEKCHGAVSAYSYMGALRELHGGRLECAGTFQRLGWLGGTPGVFTYILERAPRTSGHAPGTEPPR